MLAADAMPCTIHHTQTQDRREKNRITDEKGQKGREIKWHRIQNRYIFRPKKEHQSIGSTALLELDDVIMK